MALEIRNTYSGPTAVLVPAYDFDGSTWTPVPGTMAGGNFAATSDSRFADLVSQLTGHHFYSAVAIHDRIEWRPGRAAGLRAGGGEGSALPTPHPNGTTHRAGLTNPS